MRRGNSLSPQELDLLTRTIIGEASNQPDEGQAGVAYSILNRLKAGSFGNTAADVILAPKQYEPWTTRSRELLSIPRESPAYQRAYGIAQGAVSGEIPDPTDGATHFLQEETVRQRRGGSLPSWAQGQGLKIGDHTFFNPDQGRAMAMNKEEVPDYLGQFIKSSGAVPTTAKTSTQDDVPDYLGSYIKAQAQQQPTPSAPVTPQIGVPSIPIMPPDNIDHGDRPHVVITPKSRLQEFRENVLEKTDPRTVVPDAISALVGSAGNKTREGIEGIQKGLSSPNWMPSFATKPTTIETLTGPKGASAIEMKDPGKLLGMSAGALGALAAPITGPLDVAVTKPLESITGNKEFSEKASMLIPVGSGARVANEMRPTVKGIRSIADIVPDRYIPETLANIERNPNLSLVDISQSARNRADMIKNDALAPKAQQAVMDFVDNRKGELAGDLRQTLEVLGEIPTPYDVVNKVKARAQETGRKVIQPIVEKSKPAEVTGIINDIDKELASASRTKLPLSDYQIKLTELRDKLRGERNDRDQMFSDVKGEQGLHKTQYELRAEADNLLSSASGAERNLGGKMMPWRNRLVDAIETTNPGYKEGLSKFRTDKQVDLAFDRGLNINKKPGTTSESILEHSAESWKDWAKDPKTHPDEIATAKLGALSWMAQELEGMRSGKKLMDSPKDKVLQGKLEALFGKKTATEYIDLMRDTHRKAQTASELGSKGSQTFARGREAEASPVRVPGASNTAPSAIQGGSAALLGLAGEAALPALGMAPGGMSALLGLTLGGSRLGASAIKHGYEYTRYKSDLARRMAEANALTRPLKDQPDLIAMLRARQAELDGGGNKLLGLTGSPVFQSLPR